MDSANGKPLAPDNNWLTTEFFENRRKFPEAELMKYAGKHIAWSWDGSQIVASADSMQELHEQVNALGLDSSRVVYSYVDRPDAIYV